MPQFLYRIQPTRIAMLADGPTEQEAAIVGRHFNYLLDLVAKGKVLMAGRTLNNDASSFGIAILVTETESEAQAIMQGDPAVAEGVMQAELFPYRVALWSSAGPQACSAMSAPDRQAHPLQPGAGQLCARAEGLLLGSGRAGMRAPAGANRVAP